jgi:hypothetical protein
VVEGGVDRHGVSRGIAEKLAGQTCAALFT